MHELVPNHEPEWFETYGRIARSGKPERFTREAKHLDGQWFDVYAFRTGASGERKVAILFHDITARQEAEENLLQLKETLEERVKERTLQAHGLDTGGENRRQE